MKTYNRGANSCTGTLEALTVSHEEIMFGPPQISLCFLGRGSFREGWFLIKCSQWSYNVDVRGPPELFPGLPCSYRDSEPTQEGES